MPTVRPGVVAKISETGGILGCINEHDGTGFIHALLQSYHPGYSRMKSDQYRTNLAKSVRIGALPAVLRARYGSDPLCKEGCSEARAVFGQAVSYGSPLPPLLMKHYAEYLGTPYRLYDSNFQLIEEYEVPEHASVPCNIITTDEDEYHLVVRLAASKRGDKEGTVRFKILDESLVPE
jgi:hypothetical protein